MFPASCMCACVCIHNQGWKDRRMDRHLCDSESLYFCLCTFLVKMAAENSLVCLFRVEVQGVLQSLWTQLFSESFPCCCCTMCACFRSFCHGFKCMYRFSRFVDKPNYRGWIKQVNIPLSPWFQRPACTDFFPSSCLHPRCTEAARYSNALPFACIGSIWNLLQSSIKEAFMQKHTCFINLNNISGATGCRGSHRCWLRCQEINLSVKIRFKECLHLEEVKRWNLREEHDEIN